MIDPFCCCPLTRWKDPATCNTVDRRHHVIRLTAFTNHGKCSQGTSERCWMVVNS